MSLLRWASAPNDMRAFLSRIVATLGLRSARLSPIFIPGYSGLPLGIQTTYCRRHRIQRKTDAALACCTGVTPITGTSGSYFARLHRRLHGFTEILIL